MKTIEEMAYGYACNKLGPNAQYDNSAEIGSLQNMLIDFTQKVLVEYNRWHDIETDKDGFATSESLDAIFDKIPCLAKKLHNHIEMTGDGSHPAQSVIKT